MTNSGILFSSFYRTIGSLLFFVLFTLLAILESFENLANTSDFLDKFIYDVLLSVFLLFEPSKSFLYYFSIEFSWWFLFWITFYRIWLFGSREYFLNNLVTPILRFSSFWFILIFLYWPAFTWSFLKWFLYLSGLFISIYSTSYPCLSSRIFSRSVFAV